MPDFDDVLWENAFICRSPGGILCKNTMPPIRVTKRLTAKKINDKVYDMGQNISGWAGISVKGARGSSITVRYAEIEGEGNIEELELWGEVVHTALRQIGDFECSDEMLNKIHSASKWSTLTNICGIPADCPQREQNGWTGDALLSAEQTPHNHHMYSEVNMWFYKYLAGNSCFKRKKKGSAMRGVYL